MTRKDFNRAATLISDFGSEQYREELADVFVAFFSIEARFDARKFYFQCGVDKTAKHSV